MFFIIISFVLFFNSVNADFDHFASRSDMCWNDVNVYRISKAEVISDVEFPKARLFIEKLIKKYPKEFNNVSFYMARSYSPFAGRGFIGIPYDILVSLENEILTVQNLIEWMLLHEAGHIHHQHVKVLLVFEAMKKIGLSGVIGTVCSDIGSTLYSKYVAESQADDFAAKKCKNKKALEAGAVWLDKCTLDNPSYPSVQNRIEKINKAIERRFEKSSH
jgi:hypothetical protein